MSNKYLIDNPSIKLREKAKRAYYNALRRFSSHNIKSQENLIGEFFRAIADFFSSLSRPFTSNSYRITPESPPDSDRYNDTMQSIYDDISVAYDEQNAIEEGIQYNFNYSQTERMRLESLLEETRSRLDTYTIMSKSRESNEIWIKDSFITTEKVDMLATTSAKRAHVNINGGYVTLPIAAVDKPWEMIKDIESIRVEVPNLPATSVASAPAPDRVEAVGETLSRLKETRKQINWEDHYQGKMYGLINQQGSVLGEDGIRSDEGAIGAQATAPLFKVLFPDNRNTVDTFWEYELVVLSGEEGQWTELAPSQEIMNQNPNDTRRILQEEVRRGFITTDPRLEYSPGKTTDTYVWSQYAKPEAPSGYRLEVNLIIVLKEEKYINNLSISPHTFGKKVYPSLKNIATSNEERGDFLSLPHFTQQNIARLRGVSVEKLKKNYISMSTQQHFTFPTRKVKALKIEFIQDTPYQIGYTMGLASRNWVVKLNTPGNTYDTISYTEYAWVDILGREFMRGLTTAVTSQIRTGILEANTLENKFESITGTDIRIT